MKDLLLYVADADAQAFMNSLLNKPQALGIRQITFDIERHPQRDSGMVQSGAELTRMKKGKYLKALLTWDHHGSGRDHKQSAEEVRTEMQKGSTPTLGAKIVPSQFLFQSWSNGFGIAKTHCFHIAAYQQTY